MGVFTIFIEQPDLFDAEIRASLNEAAQRLNRMLVVCHVLSALAMLDNDVIGWFPGPVPFDEARYQQLCQYANRIVYLDYDAVRNPWHRIMSSRIDPLLVKLPKSVLLITVPCDPEAAEFLIRKFFPWNS